MLEELINMFPELKKDILVFDAYIEICHPNPVDAEWHLRTYPEEIQFYFLNKLNNQEEREIDIIERLTLNEKFQDIISKL